MTQPADGSTSTQTGQQQPGQAPDTASTGQQTTSGTQTGQPDPWAGFAWDGNVDSLPEPVAKVIRDARADAGKARTTAKQTAADQARQELAQQIGKALGIVQDDDGQVDPAKLTEQLTERTAGERDALVRLAVYETAKEHGGNPAALTDSRTFLAKAAQLDPTAADFSAQVAAAAKDAVEANPTLKAAAQAAAPAGGVEFTGAGSGSGQRTYTRAQLRDSKFFAEHRADIMAAMREGRIKE